MITSTTATINPDLETLRVRLRRLALYGLLTQDDSVLAEPWIPRPIDIEERERARRSLKRRLDNARLSSFKPLADFDWDWPTKIDRPLIDELFTLEFLNETANAVLLGPNGIGKTLLAKNLTHTAVLHGFTARFTTASDMLHDLAAQDSDSSLARRLRRYTQPAVLCIDELGYLAYDTRYADLLFEVVTRRYQHRSIILTTNKPFGEWNDVFPNAACVVTLVDRLIHRTELVTLEGDSYRLKETKERTEQKAKKRSAQRRKKINLTPLLPPDHKLPAVFTVYPRF